MRLMGSFQTIVTHGRSGSVTAPTSVPGACSRCGVSVPGMPSWWHGQRFVRRDIVTSARFRAMAVTRDPRAIGVPGLILVIVGAVMLMLSFTVLTWYGAGASANSVSRNFSDLHTATDAIVGGSRAPKWYFAW